MSISATALSIVNRRPYELGVSANSLRIDWTDPEFIAKVNELDPDCIRIPEGQAANYWDYARGGVITDLAVLPDQYHSRVNLTGSTYANMKAFFDQVRAEPLLVLNMLTSTLQDQLDVIQGFTDAGLDIRLFELGNEFYFAVPDYTAKYPTAEDYASDAVTWSNAIKAQVPDAKICIVGANRSESDVETDGNRLSTWVSQITSAFPTSEALSIHTYITNGLATAFDTSVGAYPYLSKDEVTTALSQPAIQWEDNLTADAFSLAPNEEIWVTEFGYQERIKRDETDTRPDRQDTFRCLGTWLHGLFDVAIAVRALQVEQVRVICPHVLRGSSTFGMIWDSATGYERYPEIPTTPNEFTPKGLIYKMLFNAARGSGRYQVIEFSGASQLLGILYSNSAGKFDLFCLNLGEIAIVDFSSITADRLEVETLTVAPEAINTGMPRSSFSKYPSHSVLVPPYSANVLRLTTI